MAKYDKANKEKDPTAERADALGGGSSVRFGKSNIQKKSRTWTWVVYEDEKDQVDNWLGDNPDIAWAMSPKHENDINPDGEKKKPHWHLLVSFNGPTTWNIAQAISQELGLPIPQICRNTRGMIRYFLHLDNPEKAQYDRTLITSGGGFDYESFLALSQSEKELEERNFIRSLLARVQELNITSFADVVDLVMCEYEEHYKYLRSSSYLIKQYLWDKAQRPQVDPKQEPWNE